MADTTCATCSAPYRRTHSRQIYCSPACRMPNHRKITRTCDACGGPAIKYAGKQRYVGTYCSELCRDYARWGGTKCDLPRDHMARCYGRSCAWSPPVKVRTIECDWCGEALLTSNSGQRFCSSRCKRVAKKRRRRGREHGAPGEYRFSDVMRQYRAQGYACAYCEQRCDGLPDPEHVLPLSRGGRNDMSNIVAACRTCNADKRDLTLDEWAADRARRGLPPVRTQLTGSAFLSLAA